MSPTDPNRLMEEYEEDVDEIVSACDGDVCAALKALLLVNERLENALHVLSAKLADRQPYRLQFLH